MKNLAPEGFLIAADVEFTVEETGEVQQVSMVDEVPMGQLVIKKTDAADGSALAGVGFTLTNKETGEVVAELTTGEDGTVTSDLLPIATYEEGKVAGDITYILKETKPLEGYVANEESYEITFSYQDAETKVIEVVQEITNEKAPDAPEEVKTGGQYHADCSGAHWNPGGDRSHCADHPDPPQQEVSGVQRNLEKFKVIEKSCRIITCRKIDKLERQCTFLVCCRSFFDWRQRMKKELSYWDSGCHSAGSRALDLPDHQ